MADLWDKNRVQRYIDDEIEESLKLDYKASGSLAKSGGKKNEITKDVSAMANSAGGIIIYGIAEYQDEEHKHLPEKIDPIDRTQYSKEWLEQVISNIQPRIDGVIIHPISMETGVNDVVYIVEIPQSNTAHQANDFRYYKRYNFESVPMDNYQIRDIMGRNQYPHIKLEFEIVLTQKEVPTGGFSPDGFSLSPIAGEPMQIRKVNDYELIIWAYNAGKIYAQFVNVILEIPDEVLPIESDNEDVQIITGGKRKTHEIDGVKYSRHFDDNTVRDYIGMSERFNPNYGPARHVPILPGRYHGLADNVSLCRDFDELTLDGLYIYWETYADNAPVLKDKTAVSDIKITDKR